MGFYDKKIKDLYEKCPRLVILSINSIFHKKHKPDAGIVYLDKEQSGENETFMDMLLEVEGCKYHFEFQLLEGNMAIRMYEYSVKETIRELLHEGNQDAETKEGKFNKRYEIEVIMPAQAVIFLAGANKKERIMVHLTLPDGQKVDYTLPCVSASIPIEELIRQNLFILIPFQQVQLNSRMSNISKYQKETKHRIAVELFEYHKQMKNSLEKLYEDDIITVDEYNYLIESFSDVEGYLVDKDEMVKQEVVEMGDNDYVCRSERARQEGREVGLAEGREVGLAEGRKVGLTEGRMTEVYSSVLEGDYGIKRGAEKLGLSEKEFVKRMEEAGYQVPVEAERV